MLNVVDTCNELPRSGEKYMTVYFLREICKKQYKTILLCELKAPTYKQHYILLKVLYLFKDIFKTLKVTVRHPGLGSAGGPWASFSMSV